MRSIVAGHRKLTMTNGEPSSKLVLLQVHKKLPKNSTSTILRSFGIRSKWERWESSISACLICLVGGFFTTETPRKPLRSSFWSVVFSYAKQQRTISHLDCDVQQKGFYVTTGNDQLSVWTEKKIQASSNLYPKTNLYQNKKVMVTV